MTFLYPTAPGLAANGYSLSISTPTVNSYALGNGLTGSLGAY